MVEKIANGGWWADNNIDRLMSLEVRFYWEALEEYIFPAFEKVGEKAHDRAPEYFGYDPESDRELGDYCCYMTDTEQGLQNLFAIGLYHLFEQHMISLCRPLIKGRSPSSQKENFKVVDFLNEEETRQDDNLKIVIDLFRKLDIEIKTLTGYEKIDELRILANAVKHAHGRSCDELKKINLSLFLMEGTSLTEPDATEVPMAGRDIFVKRQDLINYKDAILSFYKDLSAEIKKGTET